MPCVKATPPAPPPQEGDVVVTCHSTGEKAVVHFVPYSKAKERYRELHGNVFDEKGEVRLFKYCTTTNYHNMPMKTPKLSQHTNENTNIFTTESISTGLKQVFLIERCSLFGVSILKGLPMSAGAVYFAWSVGQRDDEKESRWYWSEGNVEGQRTSPKLGETVWLHPVCHDPQRA